MSKEKELRSRIRAAFRQLRKMDFIAKMNASLSVRDSEKIVFFDIVETSLDGNPYVYLNYGAYPQVIISVMQEHGLYCQWDGNELYAIKVSLLPNHLEIQAIKILLAEVLDGLKHTGQDYLLRSIIFNHSKIESLAEWRKIKELIIEYNPQLTNRYPLIANELMEDFKK